MTDVKHNLGNNNTGTDQKEILAKIFSPTRGKVLMLQDVNDDVFRKEIIGKGAAVYPEIDEIYAPVNGTIAYIPETKHALMMTSAEGLEILIHVGLETVALHGAPFEFHVEIGDEVSKGDLLMTFDRKALLEQGFDIVTPVVVTNIEEFEHIVPVHEDRVEISDCLINILK